MAAAIPRPFLPADRQVDDFKFPRLASAGDAADVPPAWRMLPAAFVTAPSIPAERLQIPAYAARSFTLPDGDADVGREVFTTMQCYICHTVAGETFPAYPPRKVGPALTGMGAHHPAVYFAESIINPSAVIITGEGYTGLAEPYEEWRHSPYAQAGIRC
jgi:mono/diheme cytochrome c family protein